MVAKWLKWSLLIIAVVLLAGCGAKAKMRKSTTAEVVVEHKRKAVELVILTQAFPENPAETLYLRPKSYPNGVYVCAIENLSKPCLPKLSALVAEKLAQRGILIEPDQKKAEATLYFETWFDTFSNHGGPMKVQGTNPTVGGKNFAVKIEQSLETGNLPDVHKRIREGVDPFSMVSANANDDQKFIYVAFTAIDMADAIDYPGEGEKHVGASKNPWIKTGTTKRVSWWAIKKIQAETRTLIGGYTGEVPTEKAAMPMLKDAIELLIERSGQPPKKK